MSCVSKSTSFANTKHPLLHTKTKNYCCDYPFNYPLDNIGSILE